MPRHFYGYTIVATAFSIQLVMKSTHHTFGVFLLPISEDLGWSRSLISGAYSLNMIIFGVVGVVTGRIVDKVGPRVLIAGCSTLLGLGYFWIGAMRSPWEFYIAFGVLVGVGLSGSYVPLSATIARWFNSRRGTMMGILVAGAGLGGLLGPLLAERLIPQLGWRYTSAVFGAGAFIICLALAQKLVQDPSRFGLTPYESGTPPERRLTSSEYSSMTVHQALRRRSFWTLCTAWAIHGFFGAGIVVHIYAHATDSGVATNQAALLLGVLGGAGLVGSLLVGPLLHAVGLRRATVTAFTFATVGLSGIWLTASIELLLLSVLILGLGWLAVGALVPSIVAEEFGLSHIGSLMGVVELSWALGAAIGPFALGLIVDRTGTYFLGFMIAVLGSLLCVTLTPSFTRARVGDGRIASANPAGNSRGRKA